MIIFQNRKYNRKSVDKDYKSNSPAKKFIENIFGFSIATWVGAILSFIVTPIVTRAFSPMELGKINMFQTYYTLLMYISLLGLNQGFIRYFHNPPNKIHKDLLFKVCVVMSMSFALIVVSIVLFMNDFFSHQIAETSGFFIPIFLSISILANTFLTMSSTAYRMENNITMYTTQAISIIAAGKISYISAIIWSPTYETAIIIMSISFAILALFFLFVNRNSMSIRLVNIGKKEIIPLIAFSLPLVPVIFMSYLNTSIPKLVLKQYVDFGAIGVYSAAVSIVAIITLLQSGFNTFWTPFVYENYETDVNKIRKVHGLITFAIVLFGLLVLLSQDILYLVIGSNYRESKSIFGLLLMSPIAYTIAETTGLGINISKRSHLNLITSSLTLIINLALCLILIPALGIRGAGIAVSISSCSMLIIKTILGEKYFKVIMNYKKTFSAPLIFMIASFGVFFVYNNTIIKSVLLVGSIVVLCVINSQEIMYLFKVTNSEINNH